MAAEAGTARRGRPLAARRVANGARDAPIGETSGAVRPRVRGRAFGAAYDSADVTRAVDRVGPVPDDRAAASTARTG